MEDDEWESGCILDTYSGMFASKRRPRNSDNLDEIFRNFRQCLRENICKIIHPVGWLLLGSLDFTNIVKGVESGLTTSRLIGGHILPLSVDKEWIICAVSPRGANGTWPRIPSHSVSLNIVFHCFNQFLPIISVSMLFVGYFHCRHTKQTVN
jgi:hypothetical protein